jgi:hypothetical protein
VITLFKTFLEIILFRRGPESVPHSSALFVIVVAIWLMVGVVGIAAADSYSGSALLVDLILTITAFTLYALVINAFGKSERIIRALTAILGCGAVFGAALFGSRWLLSIWLGEDQIITAAQLILLWLLWSILVEGHIIAGAIERPRVIGFLIALAVFMAQLQLITLLQPMIA